jgi:hypothetical protein
VSAEELPRLVLAPGTFLDSEGGIHSFSEAYARAFVPREPPDYLRAAIENLMLIGIGTIWYVSTPTINAPDWEFTRVADKLTIQALRFDDNRFTTNMVLHPISGGGYYAFARLNRLSIPASLAYAFTSSLIWEVVLEWKERVSINDVVATPWGGMAIGECFAKLVGYIASSPASDPSWARQAARYTLGLPAVVHQKLDGLEPEVKAFRPDGVGFSSDYFHAFRAGVGVAYAVNEHGDATRLQSIVAETEIVTIPGFLRPGRIEHTFSRGDFTEMRMRLGFVNSDLAEVDLWFRAALYGHFSQDFSVLPYGGRALAWSVFTAVANQQLWLLGHREDIGIVHLLGPAFDVWLVSPDFSVHGRVDGSVDLIAATPAAFQRWHGLHPGATVRAVLGRYGYDYGWGPSARISATLDYQALQLGLRFSYGRYVTTSGWDRKQELVTDEALWTDELIAYRIWLGIAPVSLLQARVGVEARMHGGEIEQTRTQHVEHLTNAELLLTF